jgi:hypothetical protein
LDNTMIFNKDTKHRFNRPYVLSLSKDGLYFSKSKESSFDLLRMSGYGYPLLNVGNAYMRSLQLLPDFALKPTRGY